MHSAPQPPGQQMERWDHRAVLDARLHANATETELARVKQELAGAKINWIDAQVQLKAGADKLAAERLAAETLAANESEKLAPHLQASDMQVAQVKEELKNGRAGLLLPATGAEPVESEQVASLKEELSRTKALLARKEQMFKAAEAHAQAWEKRALDSEPRATDLALEIAENSCLFQDADKTAESSEAHCRKLLTRMQELQEQCIRLKVANDHHRINEEIDRSRVPDRGVYAQAQGSRKPVSPRDAGQPCVRSCG